MLTNFHKQTGSGTDGQRSHLSPQRYHSAHTSGPAIQRHEESSGLDVAPDNDLVLSRRLGDAGIHTLSCWLDEKLRKSRSRRSAPAREEPTNVAPYSNSPTRLSQQLGAPSGLHPLPGSWFDAPVRALGIASPAALREQQQLLLIAAVPVRPLLKSFSRQAARKLFSASSTHSPRSIPHHPTDPS
jgi:hypothetical protein